MLLEAKQESQENGLVDLDRKLNDTLHDKKAKVSTYHDTNSKLNQQKNEM